MTNNPPPPPSGYHVPLDTDSPAPSPDQTGPPVSHSPIDGIPIFMVSILHETGHVCPGKVGFRPDGPHVYFGFWHKEYRHFGQYDLFPFVPEQMEWVRTSCGQVPPGRRPIQGGYEPHGDKLYHALANVDGVDIPGKAGEHLPAGAHVPFNGQEVIIQEYQILCWK
ncbi:hypothetical protein P691DRAFT_760498 [Macrolepiota fuliginosa MF-IS2]|uniref:Uncharacterized protein n=1 Tax=Macrolepiota fuliginosa MF-IS2 TaxID=1400762 RepID=A0A9P5XB17_9AGAR|nr:hypothetical protein P691DRAFT_760498 [Macrolepiota fuliginosa MF-IS2]